MPALVIVAIAAVSASLPVLAWVVIAAPDRVHRRAVANLHRGLPVAVTQRPLALGELPRRLTPPRALRSLDGLLARAGRPAAWPLERVLAVKVVGGAAVGALSLLFALSVPGLVAKLLAVAVTVVVYFLPEILLYNIAIKRNEQVQLDLPDTLDQMTIAVEAGLGFDAAMARAAKNGTGPLAEEFVRVLQDIQLGQPRRQAYDAITDRTDVTDLRRFIRAIVQADSYGVSVGDVLRAQAGEMRLKRRQRAEEKAMQIPVKVIFPLILCILPVLFIVLLGPAVMDIVAAFSE
ncbi:type II secretion system F family protein [Georgenia yuyongxinii]|uniref:Type II secretion system F family protein n=1 Tax=Georgenia yuyongxinii TaxID=2589797 RepID=A0A552WQC2_9MICO|nr:type II secretion system F family protein [Georgenia yuyongxinii]TRW44935.1 type II secretion system F family protein [Georgenia yuyongxinii]